MGQGLPGPTLAPSCDGFRALYSPHLPAPQPHLLVQAMCLRSYTIVLPHRNYLKAKPPLLPTGVSVKASFHKITASSGPTISPSRHTMLLDQSSVGAGIGIWDKNEVWGAQGSRQCHHCLKLPSYKRKTRGRDMLPASPKSPACTGFTSGTS